MLDKLPRDLLQRVLTFLNSHQNILLVSNRTTAKFLSLPLCLSLKNVSLSVAEWNSFTERLKCNSFKIVFRYIHLVRCNVHCFALSNLLRYFEPFGLVLIDCPFITSDEILNESLSSLRLLSVLNCNRFRRCFEQPKNTEEIKRTEEIKFKGDFLYNAFSPLESKFLCCSEVPKELSEGISEMPQIPTEMISFRPNLTLPGKNDDVDTLTEIFLSPKDSVENRSQRLKGIVLAKNFPKESAQKLRSAIGQQKVFLLSDRNDTSRLRRLLQEEKQIASQTVADDRLFTLNAFCDHIGAASNDS